MLLALSPPRAWNDQIPRAANSGVFKYALLQTGACDCTRPCARRRRSAASTIAHFEEALSLLSSIMVDGPRLIWKKTSASHAKWPTWLTRPVLWLRLSWARCWATRPASLYTVRLRQAYCRRPRVCRHQRAGISGGGQRTRLPPTACATRKGSRSPALDHPPSWRRPRASAGAVRRIGRGAGRRARRYQARHCQDQHRHRSAAYEEGLREGGCSAAETCYTRTLGADEYLGLHGTASQLTQ